MEDNPVARNIDPHMSASLGKAARMNTGSEVLRSVVPRREARCGKRCNAPAVHSESPCGADSMTSVPGDERLQGRFEDGVVRSEVDPIRQLEELGRGGTLRRTHPARGLKLTQVVDLVWGLNRTRMASLQRGNFPLSANCSAEAPSRPTSAHNPVPLAAFVLTAEVACSPTKSALATEEDGAQMRKEVARPQESAVLVPLNCEPPAVVRRRASGPMRSDLGQVWPALGPIRTASCLGEVGLVLAECGPEVGKSGPANIGPESTTCLSKLGHAGQILRKLDQTSTQRTNSTPHIWQK